MGNESGQKPSIGDVLGKLMGGSGGKRSAHEVIDKFHDGSELGDRCLPMIADIKHPELCVMLDTVANRKRAILLKYGIDRGGDDLRGRVLDSHYRNSVGSGGKWRKESLDALARALAQEFEIKKHNKGDQVKALI